MHPKIGGKTQSDISPLIFKGWTVTPYIYGVWVYKVESRKHSFGAVAQGCGFLEVTQNWKFRDELCQEKREREGPEGVAKMRAFMCHTLWSLRP